MGVSRGSSIFCVLGRIPDQKCKPDPGGMEDSGEIKRTCGHLTRCLQVIFKQKNRARSLDKALAKALLLFPCGYSSDDWEPVVNN